MLRTQIPAADPVPFQPTFSLHEEVESARFVNYEECIYSRSVL